MEIHEEVIQRFQEYSHNFQEIIIGMQATSELFLDLHGAISPPETLDYIRRLMPIMKRTRSTIFRIRATLFQFHEGPGNPALTEEQWESHLKSFVEPIRSLLGEYATAHCRLGPVLPEERGNRLLDDILRGFSNLTLQNTLLLADLYCFEHRQPFPLHLYSGS